MLIEFIIILFDQIIYNIIEYPYIIVLEADYLI